MTPRTFWAITIKIIGICISYFLLTTAWQAMSITITYASSIAILTYLKANTYELNVYFALCGSIAVLAIYVLLFYTFVFKTDWVINTLKLDKGYEDERFEFNISQSIILKTALTITGVLLLINITPELIKEIIFCFNRSTKPNDNKDFHNIAYVVIDSVKIIIGLLIILCSNAIAQFIN